MNDLKFFVMLPELKLNEVNLFGILRNWGSILLFSGIGYFLTAMFFGYVVNDNTWMYIQSVEKYYLQQAGFIFSGIVIGHFIRVVLNLFSSSKFFIVKVLDIPFYIIGMIISYLVINEIWGL